LPGTAFKGPHKKALSAEQAGVKKIGLEGVKEKQMLLLPGIIISP
jgi:hypothetical protein